MREFKIKDSFDNLLNTYVFDDVEDPKGIVQVIHGINENGLRYTNFGEYLNKFGYIVYVHDHVSQGKSRTKKDKNVVYFGKNGSEILVDGLNKIRQSIKTDYPDLDVFLFGHSLGSLIIRKYLLDQTNEYKKIILNGNGFIDIKGLETGILFGKTMKLFGKRRPSKIFDNMFRKTQFKLKELVEIDHFIEWLTRDAEITQLNKIDPYLFIRLSISVFVDLLQLIQEVNNKEAISLMHLEAPLLLLSGTHDPATNFGEDVIEFHEVLVGYGFNSTYKLYKEGRHDTLQEINRVEVFEDIITWMGE